MTTTDRTRRSAEPTDRHTPHGPGMPGSLRPGVRGSVLILSPGPGSDEALRDAMAWITAFEDDCGLVLEHDATELYAIARAGDLRAGLDRPRAEHEDGPCGPADVLDAVLVDGRWRLRTESGLTAPGAWADLYEHALRTAAPDTLCTVWDVMPLPAA